jgi:hypothetical protein
MLIKAFFILLIVLSPFTDVLPDEVKSLMAERVLLEDEIKLAREPHIYFIFDFKDKKIYIKARGKELKELSIKDFGFWGKPLDVKSVVLTKKSSLFTPKQSKIKPGSASDNANSADFQLDAIELADMPESYSLSLDGILIDIKPETDGPFSLMKNIYRSVKLYVMRPVHAVWSILRGNPFTSIIVSLGRKDAQVIYWTMHEGASAIIYYPGRVS